MSMGESLGPADIAALTGSNNNNRGNAGFGGEGNAWWIIIFVLFFAFGGWGNGFGNRLGNGNNGNGGCDVNILPMNGGFGGFGGYNACCTPATQQQMTDAFNFSKLDSATAGIQRGICDSTYALNNAINGVNSTIADCCCKTQTNMLQGFNGVDRSLCSGFNGVNTNIMQGNFGLQNAINSASIANMQGQNAIQTQISDCCCAQQRAIDSVNYNMATNTCAITNQMNNNTRDIIDAQNAGTRAILDYLCQDKISTLQSENQSLKLAASQAAQNNFIAANQNAQTAELIRRLGADCPQPAYVVQPPQPVTFPTNCCGGVTYASNGCNSGCGC